MATFDDKLALTYTWNVMAVPEPRSLLVLGLAVALVLLMKPHRAV